VQRLLVFYFEDHGSMAIEINWDEIAAALRPEMPDREPAGSDAARRALEMILGEEALTAGVDYYVTQRPASELVRSVLWLLRPRSAMARCRELAALSNETETRRSAVELLRVVADRGALPWVAEFLDDSDSHIQSWGIGVLDQLLWSELIEPEEAEELLERAAHHENGAVRERAEFIRSFLLARRASM
jgi:HEAT repeats